MHCLVIAGAQHSTSWMLSDSLELSGLVPLTARVAPFLTRRQQGRKSAQRPLLGQAWSLSQETRTDVTTTDSILGGEERPV